MAVKDPTKTVKNSTGPENTLLRIGRKTAEHVKLRIAEDSEERLEMQHQVESDAFFAKIIALVALILSVAMLLASYKIDHGEIMAPLKANVDDVSRLATDFAIAATNVDTYSPYIDSVYSTTEKLSKQITDSLDYVQGEAWKSIQ